MQTYENRQALIDEINKRACLFILEFDEVANADRDTLAEGVDRTPAQMIAYQLGWMSLILRWEREEQEGKTVITPAPGYKWNALGNLYQRFYQDYASCSVSELCVLFSEKVCDIIAFLNTLSEDELFLPGYRKWASSNPSNWPIWKWVQVNTIAPFTSFRAKIRKWKKVHSSKPYFNDVEKQILFDRQ